MMGRPRKLPNTTKGENHGEGRGLQLKIDSFFTHTSSTQTKNPRHQHVDSAAHDNAMTISETASAIHTTSPTQSNQQLQPPNGNVTLKPQTVFHKNVGGAASSGEEIIHFPSRGCLEDSKEAFPHGSSIITNDSTTDETRSILPQMPSLGHEGPKESKESALLLRFNNPADDSNKASASEASHDISIINRQKFTTGIQQNTIKAKRKLFQQVNVDVGYHDENDLKTIFGVIVNKDAIDVKNDIDVIDLTCSSREEDSHHEKNLMNSSSLQKNLVASSLSSCHGTSVISDSSILETPTLISSESCSTNGAASTGTRMAVGFDSNSISSTLRTKSTNDDVIGNGNNNRSQLKQISLLLDSGGRRQVSRTQTSHRDAFRYSSRRGLNHHSTSDTAPKSSGTTFLVPFASSSTSRATLNNKRVHQPAASKKIMSLPKLESTRRTQIEEEPDMANPNDTQRLLRVEHERNAASSDILLHRIIHNATSQTSSMPYSGEEQPTDDVGEDETDEADDDNHTSAASMLEGLNERQRGVALHPPNVALSVMAGAGSGKTHTMIARAIQLTQIYNIQPQHILMLTFTARAADEMKQRLAIEFAKLHKKSKNCTINQSSSYPINARLPYAKTFHSLAYYWIRRCWRACDGMMNPPKLLTTHVQQRHFMKHVIEEHVRQKQLERCCEFFCFQRGSSWYDVVHALEEQHPEPYHRALTKAEATIQKDTEEIEKEWKKQEEETEKKKKKRKKNKNDERNALEDEENERRQKEEEKAAVKQVLERMKEKELERECYFEISALSRNSNVVTQSCEFERTWKSDCEQCEMYLKLVHNARLYKHSPEDYLEEDAIIWQKYEQAQICEGRIDFDTILTVFVKLLQHNKIVRESFFNMHRYVIVDEFQDNSQVQSELLMSIVQNGQITVVGDDDQCIYEFRGASVGNFERFKQHFGERTNSASLAALEEGMEREGFNGSDSADNNNFTSATAEQRSHSVEERMLIDNYRSSGNVLKVASIFLTRCHHKRNREKTLLATKDDGVPVELWSCLDPKNQAKHIVSSIKERHEKFGVPYKEMACLFRCFRMGSEGQLHVALQMELIQQRIPYQMTGNGKTILESEVVKDLLAYVRLVTSNDDDESFCRILNKPPRRLSKVVLEKVIQHQTLMQRQMEREMKQNEATATGSKRQRTGGTVGLEESAIHICFVNVGLSKAQRNALMSFLELLQNFRQKGFQMILPELLQFIWLESGLHKWHAERRSKRKAAKQKTKGELLLKKMGVKTTTRKRKSDDSDDDDDSSIGSNTEIVAPVNSEDEEDVDGTGSGHVSSKDEKGPYLPSNIFLLVELATRHVEEWKEREALVQQRVEHSEGTASSVLSLYEISRKFIIEHASELPMLPYEYLPSSLLNELHTNEGIGFTVVKSFLSDLAIDTSLPDDQGDSYRHQKSNVDDDDKVSISTIHRAKGLEWDDVYVPYFNEGYMPAGYRNDDENDDKSKVRHRIGCAIREQRRNRATGKLVRMVARRCDCASYFKRQDAATRTCYPGEEPLTPEECHIDEERRLAHVAATRARNLLVFLSIQQIRADWSKEDSRFQSELTHALPSSVLCHKRKTSFPQSS